MPKCDQCDKEPKSVGALKMHKMYKHPEATPATPATPAPAPTQSADITEIPSLDLVVAHCEGGTCAAHAKQLEDLKEQIVTAAYDDIPDDIVREKAMGIGMIPAPKSLTLEPVEVLANG